MQNLEAYKQAVQRDFPEASNDKAYLLAFIVIGMRGKEKAECKESAEHHKIAQHALSAEVIGTQTGADTDFNQE